MRKEELVNVIESAIKNKSQYIAVAVELMGSKDVEIIINTYPNFEYKLSYYKAAYDDDLALKNNKLIRIVNCISADTMEQIENNI